MFVKKKTFAQKDKKKIILIVFISINQVFNSRKRKKFG